MGFRFFWPDAWLFIEPHVSLALANVDENDLWRLVNSYWTGSAWNFVELENLLPPDALLRLQVIYLKEDDFTLDKLKWSLTTTSDFSIESF